MIKRIIHIIKEIKNDGLIRAIFILTAVGVIFSHIINQNEMNTFLWPLIVSLLASMIYDEGKSKKGDIELKPIIDKLNDLSKQNEEILGSLGVTYEKQTDTVDETDSQNGKYVSNSESKDTLKIFKPFIIFSMFSPFVVYIIITTPSSIGIIKPEDTGAWLGYYGCILAAIIAIVGVKWSIDEQRKQLLEQNERLDQQRREDKRLEFEPNIVISQHPNKFKEGETSVFPFYKNCIHLLSLFLIGQIKDKQKHIHFEFCLFNIGNGIAKDLTIDKITINNIELYNIQKSIQHPNDIQKNHFIHILVSEYLSKHPGILKILDSINEKYPCIIEIHVSYKDFLSDVLYHTTFIIESKKIILSDTLCILSKDDTVMLTNKTTKEFVKNNEQKSTNQPKIKAP